MNKAETKWHEITQVMKLMSLSVKAVDVQTAETRLENKKNKAMAGPPRKRTENKKKQG